MIGKQHLGRIINFLINIALELVLAYVGLPIAGVITSLASIQSFVVNMTVGYTICDLIPIPAWGQMLIERTGIRSRLGCHLASAAIGGLVLITCTNFFCQFVTVDGAIPAIWLHTLPYLLTFGYMVPIIFMPVYERIVSVLTHRFLLRFASLLHGSVALHCIAWHCIVYHSYARPGVSFSATRPIPS